MVHPVPDGHPLSDIEDTLPADGGEVVASGAGYRVAYAIAEENLRLGRTVIADSVNPIKLSVVLVQKFS